MKVVYRILIPFSILILVILFFTAIRLSLPEWYNKIVEILGTNLHVSLQTAEALILFGGLVLSFLLTSIILFILYRETKKVVRQL